jgi:hypothetical protein
MYSYLECILEQLIIKDTEEHLMGMYFRDKELLQEKIIKPAITQILQTKYLQKDFSAIPLSPLPPKL